MTPQQIFDTVLTNLRTQGGPSLLNGSCAYRTPEGKKCAIGWLIPDDYSDLETLCSKNLALLESFKLNCQTMQRFLYSLDLQHHCALLRDLQKAHDCAARDYPDDWHDRFEHSMWLIARRRRLAYAPPA